MQFEVSGEPGACSIPVGLDGVLHCAPVREGALGGDRDEWTEDDTFVVECDEIARIDAWNMGFVFRGDRPSLQLYGTWTPGLFTLEGTAQLGSGSRGGPGSGRVGG